MQQTPNSIGIMQGRVVPKTLDRLQVFPDQWEKEFRAMKEIGFNHVELLDDKENTFRELLQKQKKEFFDTLLQSGLHCSSVCADQLCSYSLLQNPREFKNSIDGLLQALEGQGTYAIVVPFFDENRVDSREELKKVLEELAPFDETLQARGFRFAIEVPLPAEDIIKAIEGFSFQAIGVCYDIGNSIGNGFSVSEEIKMFQDTLVHVHVKDKENGKNVRLGANPEKLSAAFQALRDIQYKGLFTLETWIMPDPFEEAQMNFETTKKYVEQNV